MVQFIRSVLFCGTDSVAVMVTSTSTSISPHRQVQASIASPEKLTTTVGPNANDHAPLGPESSENDGASWMPPATRETTAGTMRSLSMRTLQSFDDSRSGTGPLKN